MADLGAIAINPTTPISVRRVASPITYVQRTANDPKLLDLDITGVISGTVLVAGVPRAGVSVGLLYHPSMRLVSRTTTASDGTYSFSGLNKDDLESYTVIAQDPSAQAPYLRTSAHDHISAG